MTQVERANPFIVDDILGEVFDEAQPSLKRLAEGSYYWVILKDRNGLLQMKPRTGTNTLGDAYTALNHAFFEYYYLTEKRFLQLFDRCLHLIAVMKAGQSVDYLKHIGYIQSEEPGETAELFDISESDMVKTFTGDFQHELRFEKLLARSGELDFTEFRGLIKDLLAKASNVYDADRAEILRGSSSLGTLMRLIAGVSKAEGFRINADFHDVFRHYKFTHHFARRMTHFRISYKHDILDGGSRIPHFLPTMHNNEMKFREALFLSGINVTAFQTFLLWHEKRRLNGNQISFPEDRKNFDGGILRGAARNWLSQNASEVRVKELISIDHKTQFLRTDDNDTRVPERNMEIVMEEAKEYNRTQREMTAAKMTVSPTPTEVFNLTGPRTSQYWGTADPPLRKSSSTESETSSNFVPIFLGLGALAYIAMNL